MIKIGIRNNLLYPLIFCLTYGFTRIISILLSETFMQFRARFLLGFLKFIFEFIIGILFMYSFNSKSKSNQNTQEKGVKLIQNNNNIQRPDSEKKIFFLMTLAALFEFIGTNTRRYVLNALNHKEPRLMHLRLRSLEIVTSSLLSYYFLKIKIYKHQYVTLIIISVSLLIALVLEFLFIDDTSHISHVLEGLVVLLSSTISTSAQDISEKYLFDIDFIDVFKITAYEGLIDTLICIPFFSFKTLRTEVSDIFKIGYKKTICIIIYLLLYAMLCGFKGIYRRHTLIQYSPMTRALAESIWDPAFIVYSDFIKTSERTMHSILSFILSLIMVFCSCVYNELLVLYCCGMEHETYIEVNKRAIISKIETDESDLSLTKSNEEEKEKEEKKNLFD